MVRGGHRGWRAAVAAALLATPWASAEELIDPPPQEKATARRLGLSGVKKANANDCPAAITELEKAVKLYPAPTLLVPLGRCQAKLGQVVEATETFRRAARLELPENSSSVFFEAQMTAQHLLDQTLPKLAKLTIRVRGLQPDAEVHIKLDDKAVSAALVDQERPTNPGDHVISVTAPGYTSDSKPLSLAPGEAKEILLSIRALPKAAGGDSSGANADPTTDPTTDTSAGNQRLGLVLLGVGGIATLAGSVFGFLALQKKNDLDEKCPNTRCAPEHSDEIDAAKQFGLGSTIGIGIGIASLGVGAYFLLTGSSKSSGASSPSASLFVNPTSVGLRGRF